MSQISNESLDRDLSIVGIEDRLKKSDEELFENLRLFAERIMLYRITRAKDKSAELGVFARILAEVGTMSENPENLLEEISGIESLAKKELTKSEETNLFSTMVQATENLSARELYYLLEKLRSEPMST